MRKCSEIPIRRFRSGDSDQEIIQTFSQFRIFVFEFPRSLKTNTFSCPHFVNTHAVLARSTCWNIPQALPAPPQSNSSSRFLNLDPDSSWQFKDFVQPIILFITFSLPANQTKIEFSGLGCYHQNPSIYCISDAVRNVRLDSNTASGHPVRSSQKWTD